MYLKFVQQARPAVLAFLLALAAIAGAWFFQIAIDLVPCPLCLQQRWPYYVGLPLVAAGLAMISQPGDRLVSFWMFAAAAVIFMLGAGMGVYHSGIEWGWWPGPASCSTGAGSPSDAGNLIQQMATTKVVKCDEAAWRFLGLSLAGYNVLISLAAAGLLAMTMGRMRRG